jgi:signal transduction histidine kinase
VGLSRTFGRLTGMGINNMTYRAKSIGGNLTVARRQPKGTVVTCSFPEQQAKNL